MNVQFNPHTQFVSKKDQAKAWADFSATEAFADAANAAMLMVVNQASAHDMASAAARQFEIQGARRFLMCLLSLGMKDTPMPRVDHDNLRHDIKP